MSDKVLFVDDEPILLQGYQRLLRKEFEVVTALSGGEALAVIQRQGPFAVVLSDMRMPIMNGIEFLSKVKKAAPDTVRIMLTGTSELRTAIDAVNEGNIFRFLSKPSNKDTLVKVLTEGVAQHRLICAEKELLEKTLRGTVYVLSEVLNLVSPAAFSRAMRVRRYVLHVVQCLDLGSPWKFEVAAMLSQLGCVTLNPDIIETVYSGGELSAEDQAQYVNHPRVAQDLLKGIPRMEPIAWMIAHQYDGLPQETDAGPTVPSDIRLGARILRAALTFDSLLRKRLSRVEAALRLTTICPGLDSRIVDAMVELEPEVAGSGSGNVPVTELDDGMMLDQDVRSQKGPLVAAKGQEVTSLLRLKLKSFLATGVIADKVAASHPKH